MITGIVLENFKCFERVEINPKRVTCFVGANGTGKSSVLQAFGLLKQSVEAVRVSRSVNALSLGCDLKLSGPLVSISDASTLNWSFDHGSPDIFFKGTRRIRGGEPYSYRAVISEGSLQPHELLRGLEHELPFKMLTELRIIPAVRGFTRSVHKLKDLLVPDVAMEDGFAQQEAQTATNLAYSPTDLQKISPILKRVTGVGLRAFTVPPQAVEVKSIALSGPVNVVLEGFGTNSLIMLLLQLTSAEKGATVMIEEPEIHLHPKAQAELAEVLTEVALEEDKQVIMTTHSEHITGRLLTLVAEGKLTPDDVAIYAFEKDDQGVCTAKDLKVSDDGRIEGSIGDFFEVNLAEMNRMVKALSDRNDQAG